MFERYSSAVWFLDCVHCCIDNGGSQPISNLFGVKPVVGFLQLLWTAVAMGSHLLHLFWLVAMRRRYCLIHWFVHSERLSV
jgi:hypothetical protein